MTKCLFRIETTPGGARDVLAVFLEPWSTSGYMLASYAHIGQHGPAAWDYVKGLRNATPAEAEPLLEELRRVGYEDIKVIRRLPSWSRIMAAQE